MRTNQEVRHHPTDFFFLPSTTPSTLDILSKCHACHAQHPFVELPIHIHAHPAKKAVQVFLAPLRCHQLGIDKAAHHELIVRKPIQSIRHLKACRIIVHHQGNQYVCIN